MNTVKLSPAIKDYIWGGNKFRSLGKKSDLDRIAECWELSVHKDGISIIDSGHDKGKLLSEVMTKDDWGKNCSDFEFFPVLVKLIDAADNLSVQVHPRDSYALAHEGQFGKTEMWYVIDADAGAGLYCGFKEEISKEEFINSAKRGEILDKLNFFEVKKGDCFFIESGTVHAIGKGVTIVEVQQNSNLTYRVFDYFRKGADGNPRELHIEKAAAVANLCKYEGANKSIKGKLSECKYFSVSYGQCSGSITLGREDTFISITILNGLGKVDDIDYNVGDTFFIPAKAQAKITGESTYILTEVN